MKMECVLMIYLCALIFGLPTVYTVQHKDEIIFNYNNTYKYNVPYTVSVSKRMEYIMEFGGGVEAYDTPARVTVASDSANQTYPLFITARQQKGVFSWQLPMLVQTPVIVEQFTNISRTLCPHNNPFSEDMDTCDVSSLNTPIIHLTSSSPDEIKVTIQVETVQDFYIKLNGTPTNLTSTPSQPKYYFYPFNQSKTQTIDVSTQNVKRKQMCHEQLDEQEQSKLDSYMLRSSMREEDSWLSRPKSVIVMIESPDDICAVVSIQNYSCPVFDNERDILYDGYYLTMTRRGGITLTQDTFPMGFYIVFIVKTSDDDCTDRSDANSTLPKMAHYLGWGGESVVYAPANDGRVKQFSFKIIETISYKEYLIAAGAGLAFFASFYVVFVVVAVAVYFREHSRPPAYEAMGSASGEAAFSPPTRDAPRTRRRHVAVTDASGSGEGSSRRLGDGDITASDQRTAEECGSSSSSDTESGFSTQEEAGDKDPYRDGGGTLCVANLAKCRPRVLSARSKMYLWNVLTVAVFYTLPVIQLVVTYQRLLNQSGNQDLCYFNFLCAHPLMVLSDFNHVYSNLGYVLLGFLFLMQVWRRQQRYRARGAVEYHKASCAGHPPMVLLDFNHVYSNLGSVLLRFLFLMQVWRRQQRYRARGAVERELGIPQHFGLLYAMGVALVSEGILSAAYHVCPNSMNFQFDTSFMYVTSVLCMVKIYQSRHPDINARAHATFGVLALIIFVGLVGVLNANFYFWIAFTLLHLITCLVMTFQIYYLGRFRIDGAMLSRALRVLAARPLAAIAPARAGRCALLLIANLANWAIAAYGVSQHSRDFASHLLLVLMSNLFLYTLFYIVMKLLHRETIRWYSWVYIALTYTVWFGSSYFYLDQSTNWALTPAQSRQSNRVCSFLELYDSHDMWHFLSSCAMFFSFNMYLTIDDNLARVPRNNIMVF